MALFSTRKPRKFNRISIYTNERRDKLDKLVRDVKREIGELPEEEKVGTYDYKGKFSRFTPRAQRASGGAGRLTLPVVVLIIFLLVMVWRYILTGKILF